MSFGNKLQLNKVVIGTAIAFFATAGLLMAEQVKAASNCTGPTFDAGTRTLSLVCTESTDIHELSCLDAYNPDTLFLSVNGLAETITCPPDLPPNTAPSVTVAGPLNGSSGTNHTFTITGTDTEGGNLIYQVDWDNNLLTPPDYVSGAVPSGTSLNVAQSWVAAGSYTFGARAIDDQGLPSAWVTHSITVSTPPTVSIYIDVNGVSTGGADQTINPGDNVTISWDSNNATTCTSADFATGNAADGTNVALSEPAPGTSRTYSITCTGSGVSVTEDVVITTRQLPNLISTGIGDPNITGTLDTATGLYSSISVSFGIRNDSGSDTTNSFTYDLNISVNGYNVTESGTVGTIAAGDDRSLSEAFTNVPFGNMVITLTIDPGNSVAESNDGDNTYTRNASMLPTANMQITADNEVVREGQTTVLRWDTGASYLMNCTVSGPTISPVHTFTSNTARTGNRIIGPVPAKSEYLLSCTEPLTNTTFTESLSVDVIPNAQET